MVYNKIEPTKTDKLIAKRIITDPFENYLIRYLRGPRTVGLSRKPVRNVDGGIISKADWVVKPTICAGVPYACLIAFHLPDDDRLLIDWSKRINTDRLAETGDAHELYQGLLRDTEFLNENHDDYQVIFDLFMDRLTLFMRQHKPAETEIPFSKKEGKIAAVLRGIYDVITIDGKKIQSKVSGPIPSDVAKALPQFINRAERFYKKAPVNVKYVGRELTASITGLPAKV